MSKAFTVKIDGKIVAAAVSEEEAQAAKDKFGDTVKVRPFIASDTLFLRLHETIERVERGLATYTDANFLEETLGRFHFMLSEETNGFTEWDCPEAMFQFRILTEELDNWDDGE